MKILFYSATFYPYFNVDRSIAYVYQSILHIKCLFIMKSEVLYRLVLVLIKAICLKFVNIKFIQFVVYHVSSGFTYISIVICDGSNTEMFLLDFQVRLIFQHNVGYSFIYIS